MRHPEHQPEPNSPDHYRAMDDADLKIALRRALTHEADLVRPSSGGLAAIQERLAATPPAATTRPSATRRPRAPRALAPWRWPRSWVVPGLAAAAVLALMVLAPALTRGPSRPADQAPAVQASQAAAPAPLPVYFITANASATAPADGSEWRLVREYRPTTITDPAARVASAVRLAVSGNASDIDDTSVWRRDQVSIGYLFDDAWLARNVNVAVTDSEITIALDPQLTSEPVPAVNPADATTTGLAMQQLVWTATAASGSNLPVRLVIAPGAGASPSETAPTDAPAIALIRPDIPLRRSDLHPDLRAPIWVNTITDGQIVSTGKVTVSGDVSATGTGTPTWQLTRQDGTAAPTAGALSVDAKHVAGRREWSVDLTIKTPGTYLLTVTAGSWADTKVLRVH